MWYLLECLASNVRTTETITVPLTVLSRNKVSVSWRVALKVVPPSTLGDENHLKPRQKKKAFLPLRVTFQRFRQATSVVYVWESPRILSLFLSRKEMLLEETFGRQSSPCFKWK